MTTVPPARNPEPLPADPFPAVAAETIIARSTSVIASEVDGEVLMMSIEKGCYFGLNDIAGDIWRRIDPPCSFASLVDGLAADYDASVDAIATDVRSLLRDMLERDVVVLQPRLP
jgi:Coenzyme PQQ synthesis protein D (PqqD)